MLTLVEVSRWPIAAAAAKRGVRPDDVEDCVQEVLMYLLTRDVISNHDPERASLKHWLWVVIRARIDHFRSTAYGRKRFVAIPEDRYDSVVADPADASAFEPGTMHDLASVTSGRLREVVLAMAEAAKDGAVQAHEVRRAACESLGSSRQSVSKILRAMPEDVRGRLREALTA